MNNRDVLLTKAFEENFNPVQIFSLLNYRLTDSDSQLITATAIEVLKKSPNIAFNCAAMSALWGAMIQDNSNIPVAIICGDLTWNKTTIFKCKEPIRISENMQEWDGHCWLEMGGYIADISIFRTVNNEPKLKHLKSHLVSKLGSGRGMLYAEPSYLNSMQLQYLPRHSLSEIQINGIINGHYKLG